MRQSEHPPDTVARWNGPGLSSRVLFLAALALSLMMGVLDWASGYELQFFVFYFIPITLAGWNCGLARTLVIAVLCGGLWFSIDLGSGHPYTNWFYSCWSALIRISSFLINGYSVVRIRDLVVASEKARTDLQRARETIQSLEKLLPLCATCKEPRDTDTGYRIQIEAYLVQHPEAFSSLGHCAACTRRLFQERLATTPSGGPFCSRPLPPDGAG